MEGGIFHVLFFNLYSPPPSLPTLISQCRQVRRFVLKKPRSLEDRGLGFVAECSCHSRNSVSRSSSKMNTVSVKQTDD